MTNHTTRESWLLAAVELLRPTFKEKQHIIPNNCQVSCGFASTGSKHHIGQCWYEIVSVYGTTIKELIHEEFGDGIMSAIDFSMDIVRQPDPKGDRVNVVLSGKFLPYKQY